MENGNGARAIYYCWRVSYMHSEKSSLVLIVVMLILVYA